MLIQVQVDANLGQDGGDKIEKGTRDRHFGVGIKMKLQEAGEGGQAAVRTRLVCREAPRGHRALSRESRRVQRWEAVEAVGGYILSSQGRLG